MAKPLGPYLTPACWLLAAAALGGLFWFDTVLYLHIRDFSLHTHFPELVTKPRPMRDMPFWTPAFDFLRTLGKWPMLALAGVLLAALRPGGCRWALVLAVSLGSAAGAAELVWRTVSRVRPSMTAPPGSHVFLTPFSGFGARRGEEPVGPSFPSSEAALSTAAAGVLAAAVPTLAPLWYALAAGCALMRVEKGDHFPSDVWAGAMLGLAVAQLCVAAARRLWRDPAFGGFGAASVSGGAGAGTAPGSPTAAAPAPPR